MDYLVLLAMVWLASVAATATVGYFRGRVDDALTVGILLGPVGLALTLRYFQPLELKEKPAVVSFRVAEPCRSTEGALPLRRAA